MDKVELVREANEHMDFSQFIDEQKRLIGKMSKIELLKYEILLRTKLKNLNWCIHNNENKSPGKIKFLEGKKKTFIYLLKFIDNKIKNTNRKNDKYLTKNLQYRFMEKAEELLPRAKYQEILEAALDVLHSEIKAKSVTIKEDVPEKQEVEDVDKVVNN